ncbi:lipocalin family protein [Gramella sp. MAR_2010_147]|uniref:lipocalin family protein n=1 Tax=Gramella sp. MAR_2010_147 TaxID=1250205 RepID=UPI00087DBF5C|nr:lipocalin family protein [Gramella sp. MAR_2010_147]SDR95034.1 Lipocalin-like domain-containing protein [Gramella sp. MAR_2010_147]
MKKLILLFSIFAMVACSNNDPQEQLKKLNGYWQIEKVEIENDSVVEYSLSQYIDYIEINESVGFRKKLKPKIDGGFIQASNDSEKITAKIEGNNLILYYSTPFAEWKEKVLEVTDEKLVILNRDDKKYYYDKYEPLLSQDEEKTKE